ncbi:MAG: 3-deoxy-manno-octulosonate cytidylyltransferase [Bacteroidia bacterium]|nr:3-deoxy-manno-octulosonate cytidylyltransferase [Bacteroidia bacterium]
MNKILGVIPARYASTRFPGKPLIEIKGKSMIQRVYEQACKAGCFQEVVIATDSDLIVNHVKSWGGEVIMTGNHHVSGTDRVGEVAGKFPDYSHYVNIQGDEPFIETNTLVLLTNTLLKPGTQIATLLSPIKDTESLMNPGVVKAVTDKEGFALYFSRHPVPFFRNEQETQKWIQLYPYFKHLGIYGFTKEILMIISRMQECPLETAESLEQLRWLYNGLKIRTSVVESTSIAIDTPEDLIRLRSSSEFSVAD